MLIGYEIQVEVEVGGVSSTDILYVPSNPLWSSYSFMSLAIQHPISFSRDPSRSGSTRQLRTLVAGGFLCDAVVHAGPVPVGRRSFRHLSGHRQPHDPEPALLQLLRLSGEAVDGFGLGETEAGRRVGGPGAVLHAVAQQGDGALGFHVLRVRVRENMNTQLLTVALVMQCKQGSVVWL